MSDWIEGLGPSAAVKREMAQVGERTSGLLNAAAETAASVVSDAEAFARTVRGEAYARSQAQRAQAQEEAERVISDARQQANQLLAIGRERRGDLETIIADLSERREALLAELEALAGSLVSTITRLRENDLGQRASAGASDPLDALGQAVESRLPAGSEPRAAQRDEPDGGPAPQARGGARAEGRFSSWLPPRSRRKGRSVAASEEPVKAPTRPG